MRLFEFLECFVFETEVSIRENIAVNNVTFIIGNHDFLLFHFMKKVDLHYATLQIKLTCRILQCIYKMAEFPQ